MVIFDSLIIAVEVHVLDHVGDEYFITLTTQKRKFSGLMTLTTLCSKAAHIRIRITGVISVTKSNTLLWLIVTGAGEQLFYEAPHGTRLLIPDATTSELAWASPLTCPLDATLEGVWAPEMDLTDINAVATANHLPLVAAAADDQGLLRLFKYPSKVC